MVPVSLARSSVMLIAPLADAILNPLKFGAALLRCLLQSIFYL